MKETIAKISKTKNWLFDKIKLTDHQTDLLRKIKTQINKTRNKKGEVTTDNSEIQRIIRDYHEQLYANKMDKLEELDKFLVQSHNAEPGSNRSDQTIHKHQNQNCNQKSFNKQKSRARWLPR